MAGFLLVDFRKGVQNNLKANAAAFLSERSAGTSFGVWLSGKDSSTSETKTSNGRPNVVSNSFLLGEPGVQVVVRLHGAGELVDAMGA